MPLVCHQNYVILMASILALHRVLISIISASAEELVYASYSIISSMQNYFEFEQRDWMTVSKEELPPGNRLVLFQRPNSSIAHNMLF